MWVISISNPGVTRPEVSNEVRTRCIPPYQLKNGPCFLNAMDKIIKPAEHFTLPALSVLPSFQRKFEQKKVHRKRSWGQEIQTKTIGLLKLIVYVDSPGWFSKRLDHLKTGVDTNIVLKHPLFRGSLRAMRLHKATRQGLGRRVPKDTSLFWP